MKKILLLLLSVMALQASVYYSKVEPYETRKIASNVTGVVVKTHENMIGKHLSIKPYIEIDSLLDKDDLRVTKEKLTYLKNTVTVNQKILKNLAQSLEKKRVNYDRVKKLKIKSSVEKDKEFYDLVSSENAALSTQKEINTLEAQIADLQLHKVQLQRSINDKTLQEKGFKLYSIEVKVGQVVNKGTPLATLVDDSRAILTIFLNEEDVANAKKKIIYINGVKTAYKIGRLLNIADSKNISKYKAQIIIKAPKLFSKLVQVELKDE